ncbi:hypothetical protein J7K93_10525 [bacterium]|nr:hypothetical protein [bacterium]
MSYQKITIGILISAVFFTGCFHLVSKKRFLLPTDCVAVTNIVKSNTLKIQKKPNSKIETLQFADAIIENKGTKKENKCLCQAVCFRVSQLATQAWEDNVFRTYEVKRIRTGWNTDGPYEFFSDRELNGEIGDLEIPAEKIVVEKRNGDKATSPKDLTIEDSWYEITFTNNLVLFFQVKEGENGVYPAGFLTLRSKMKNGDKNTEKPFLLEMKKTLSGIAELPFKGIIVEKVGTIK